MHFSGSADIKEYFKFANQLVYLFFFYSIEILFYTARLSRQREREREIEAREKSGEEH
jgi:hypothetical protein